SNSGSEKKIDISLEQQELSRIAMIVESSTDCYAKNSYGDFIDITVEECKSLSRKNNRMSFSKIKKEQNPQESYSVSMNENVDYKQPV
ncbi:zonular occludens toxin, partial [Acinetobacter baumannii]|nr:zonular occludens toxin [Acinetobacter baumannii]